MSRTLYLIVVLLCLLAINVIPFRGPELHCYVGMQYTDMRAKERGFPLRYFHQTHLIGDCTDKSTNERYAVDASSGHKFYVTNFVIDGAFALAVFGIAWHLTRKRSGND